MKSAYDQVESAEENQSQIVVEYRIIARDLLDQAQALEDAMDSIDQSDIGDAQAEMIANRVSAKQMRSVAASMSRSLDVSSKSSDRTLKQSLNSLVYNVQSLMNQYEQLVSQRTVAAKSLEVARRPSRFSRPWRLRAWR